MIGRELMRARFWRGLAESRLFVGNLRLHSVLWVSPLLVVMSSQFAAVDEEGETRGAIHERAKYGLLDRSRPDR